MASGEVPTQKHCDQFIVNMKRLRWINDITSTKGNRKLTDRILVKRSHDPKYGLKKTTLLVKMCTHNRSSMCKIYMKRHS